MSDVAVVEVEGALTLTLSGAVEVIAIVEDLSPVEVVMIAEQGPAGPPGAEGSGGSGGGNLVVAASDPGLTVPGLWIQTGLGAGDDMTFWVEDGV